MLHFLGSAIESIGSKLVGQVYWLIGLAALFTVIRVFSSQVCTPGKAWWRSRDLVADTHYFFLVPLFMPYLKAGMILFVFVFLKGLLGPFDVDRYLVLGAGPLSHLSIPAQAVIYVVGADFLFYWTHRLFHDVSLWPFHAVHHSAEDVDWTTSYRAHPVEALLRSGLIVAIMLILGISPEIIVALVPFDVISAAFVHSNLNWTLGPLKYVVSTPVFHRWHHCIAAEAHDKNFGATFAIWDVIFGTFYMPQGQLPQEFGVDDPTFPKTFFGHMVAPFKEIAGRMRHAPPKPVDAELR